MSSTATPVLSHPLVDFTTRVGAALEQAQAFPAWSMTAREQASVIVALAKARAGLEEVQLRVLAAADGNDVAATTAATSTTAWLAHATTRAPGAASSPGPSRSSPATRPPPTPAWPLGPRPTCSTSPAPTTRASSGC